MAENTFCGCALETLVNAPTPFKVAQLLDWYDGEVSGILQCQSLPAELYTFEMIDWYQYGPLRVYALSPCQPSDLAEMLDVYQEPMTGLPLDQLKVKWEAAQQIMKRSWAPKFIMAWDTHTEHILAMRELPAEMQAQTIPYIAEEDDKEQDALHEPVVTVKWFDFLNLTL